MSQTDSPSREKPAGPTPLPKTKRGVWFVVKWSLVILFLMLAVLVLINFRLPPGKRKPFVPISPQTTWATSPIKPDGDVDYVAYLNQQYAVTPENNAFVEILKINGPIAERQMPPARFFELLGVHPPPASGDYFRDFPFVPMLKGTPSVMPDGTELDCEQVYKPSQGDPYLLYSLGPNKMDDGGIAMDEGQYLNIDLTAAPKIRTVQDWIAEEMKKE